MPRSPTVPLGHALADDDEAISVLSEASHRIALAEESAQAARRCLRAMADARRRWDDVRHRLDPRGRRGVSSRLGRAVLAIIAACLLVLDLPMMHGVTGSSATLPLAMCATTTWLIAAWRGAVAWLEQQRQLCFLIASGTAALSLLIVLVHILGAASQRALDWDLVAMYSVTILLVDALTIGAATLIARIEPSAVASARASWRRDRRHYLRALRQERRDAEAASRARKAWFDFARVKAGRAETCGTSETGSAAQDILADALRALDHPMVERHR